MIPLRQSTASQEIPLGRFVDSTDGNTQETALTIANTDIKIWKTGTITLANKNLGGATHMANGEYYAVLDATDTDTIGPMKVAVHVTGALAVQVWCCVFDEAVYDVLFGTTALSTYAGGDTSGTTTLLSRVVGTIATGTHNPQSGDAFARLGAPAGASVSADILAMQADTDDIQTRLPAALVSGRIDASVGAMAANVVTASAVADGAIDRAALAADTGLQAIRSNTAQAGAAGSITLDASASATDDYYNDALIYLTGGTGAAQVRRIRDYVGATKVATIVPNWITTPDATSTFAVLPLASVWDETLTDHLDSGSTGAALNAAGSAGDPWGTALPGAYGAGTAGNILGNRLVGTLASGTHNPQSGDAFARLGAPAGASVSADIAVIEGQTDDIGVAGAGLTAIPDSAGVTTLLGRIPAALFSGITSLAQWLGLLAGKQVGNATARTEIQATGAGAGTFDETTDALEAIRDTPPLGTAMRGTDNAALASVVGTPSNLGSGATVAANLVDIEAQTDDIGVAGAGLTAVPWNAAWDVEVQSECDDALVARSLDKLVLASGTADSGSTTTMVDAARTEADADYWKGRLILFTSGTIAGQCAIITDFNATTDTFTFAPALTQAVLTQTYIILPGISVWDDILAEHLASGTTGAALNAAGSAGDPWNTALPGAYGAGTAGNIMGNRLDAAMTTRLAPTVAGRTLDVTTTGEAGIDLDNTAGTLAKGTDLTGFNDLDAAGVRAAVGLATANLDTQLDTLPTAAETATSVWAAATRTLSAFGFSVTVGTNNDKTGYGLSSAAVQAIWDAATLALTTVGSIGKKLADWTIGTTQTADVASRPTLADIEASATLAKQAKLDTLHDTRIPGVIQPQTGDGFARLGAPAGLSVSADIAAVKSDSAAIKAKTDLLTFTGTDVRATLDSETVTVATNNDKTGYALTTGERDAIAAALLDLANGVETSYTVRQTLRVMASVLAGKVSGYPTGPGVFRNMGDTANRVSATNDANGNRTTMTLTP